MDIRFLPNHVTGISPFDDMPVNAFVWREAHSQHNIHRRLHATASHRPGIVWGLEVFVSPRERQCVVVAPGIAIDSNGQTLLLSEPVKLIVEPANQVFIVIEYEEAFDASSAVRVPGGERHYRFVEGRRILVTSELPAERCLELARIYRSRSDQLILNPINPLEPKEDELNFLYRKATFPLCHGEGGIGQLVFLPKGEQARWDSNSNAICRLIREANCLGFNVHYGGVCGMSQAASDDLLVLYAAGKADFIALSLSDTAWLANFLNSGGTLLVETMADSTEFRRSFFELVAILGASLKPVERGNNLLSSYHFFSAPPHGGQSSGEFMADLERGILFSTFDYGGAWKGEGDEVLGRERIRSAYEFGFNIISWAAQRKRAFQLLQYA